MSMSETPEKGTKRGTNLTTVFSSMVLLWWALGWLQSAFNLCVSGKDTGNSFGQNHLMMNGWSCSFQGIKTLALVLLPLWARGLWQLSSKWLLKSTSKSPCTCLSFKDTLPGPGNLSSGWNLVLTGPSKSSSSRRESHADSSEKSSVKGLLRWSILLISLSMSACGGFSRGVQHTIQFEDLAPAAALLTPFSKWLSPGRVQMELASWNARALFHSSDVDKRHPVTDAQIQQRLIRAGLGTSTRSLLRDIPCNCHGELRRPLGNRSSMTTVPMICVASSLQNLRRRTKPTGCGNS